MDVNSGPPKPETRSSSPSIEQAKGAFLAHFAGAVADLDSPISVRANSEIFRTLIRAPVPLEVALKICVIPGTKTPDSSIAKVQYHALTKVSGQMLKGDARYRVPTPLWLNDDLGTFAMTWADGDSLTRKLTSHAVFVHGAAWFENVGAWLGNFHKAGPLRREAVNLSDRLALVDEITGSVASATFSNAIRALRTTAPMVKDLAVEASWLHGDCKIDNFILGSQNVYGIDIALAHDNAIEYDLAQFLNNLDLLLSSTRYAYLWGSRLKFEAAFLKGYSRAGGNFSMPYLNWLRLNFLLSFWHNEAEARKGILRAVLVDWMFSNAARRLSRKVSLSA
jgi:hypothetical protein